MSKSTPSLLALLGLVAVAGYQNRSKISDMLADARQGSASANTGANPGAYTGTVADQGGGGLLSEIGRLFQGGIGGGSLSNGLSDLVDRFKSSGRSAPADSWVANGPNMPINVDDLEGILGEETLRDLSLKTGMTRSQLLLRLNANLPDVVNQFTPNGRIPTESEVQALV